MARLTYSNPWFYSQKVDEKNNPGRNKEPGRAPCYIFQVSGKYSQGFIFPILPLILITAAETAGENPLLVRKRQTLLLYALSVIMWDLFY